MTANWQKIGGVEVCEGTDGAVGVWNGKTVVLIRNSQSTPGWGLTKVDFEKAHCRPLREIEECADGSVIVRSVEKIDGKTARCAVVAQKDGRWCWDATEECHACCNRDEAIAAAVTYVSAR